MQLLAAREETENAPRLEQAFICYSDLSLHRYFYKMQYLLQSPNLFDISNFFV